MPDERENDRPSGEGRDRRSPARRSPQADRARHVDRGRPRGDRYRPPAGRSTASAPDRQPPDRRAAGERDESRADPPTDPEITGRELDDEVRSELSTLSGGAAGAVARHLVMAGRLLDDDPALAYRHALAARRRAARVGVVREAAGVAAYAAGRYADALAELRAARRITGSAAYLPMMADSERGLGRPRRALDLAADPAVAGLDIAGRMEMLIVAAGARRDLGQLESAAVSLQVPELRSRANQPWVARLRYAYADVLVALGRLEEARRWFLKAAEADRDEQTEAIERIEEIDAAASAPDDR